MSWDEAAATFDEEPDHGLRDPAVRAAWAAVLLPRLPSERCRIADLGCGTGSVSALFAEAGHEVHGVDQSPRMLEIARGKAEAVFLLGDAADPPLERNEYDVVFARHVLWTLPAEAVGRWVELLRPGGKLVLVEGRWETGVGAHGGGVPEAGAEAPSAGGGGAADGAGVVGWTDRRRQVSAGQRRVRCKA